MVASEDQLQALGQPSPGRRARSWRRWVLAAIVVAALTVGAVALWHGPGNGPAQTVSEPPSVAPAVPAADRLTWAPPTLRHPVQIHITEGQRNLKLDPNTDYRLFLPSDRPLSVDGGLVITGGHNVVLIGGEIEAPSEASAPSPPGRTAATARRGLYLKDQTGTVHIEGVKIFGDLSEGIDLDERLGAVVQLENLSVGTVRGSLQTNHADLIQTWAGPTELRVDGFSGSTGYQGFFLLPDQFAKMTPTSFDLRRVVITAVEGAGYLLWTRPNATWLSVSDVVLVDPLRDNLAKMLWPTGSWEGVRLQATDAGVRLPAGTPGLDYQSPGYLSDSLDGTSSATGSGSSGGSG